MENTFKESKIINPAQLNLTSTCKSWNKPEINCAKLNFAVDKIGTEEFIWPNKSNASIPYMLSLAKIWLIL